MLVAAILCAGRLAESSGCFGGEPDIVPRHKESGLPINTQVRIARRAPAAVSWTGPDGIAVEAREQRIGKGAASARILTPTASLPAGLHTIRTKDPDGVQCFNVGAERDERAPRMRGTLSLESEHAPEPDSSCPENTWIRATFSLPEDDRTRPEGFSYLVDLQNMESARTRVELLVHAEALEHQTVRFRVGETGCGCIPRARLDANARYRVTIRALDIAGHRSREAISGEITVLPSRGSR